MYRYQFTSTTSDLLDAEEAERSSRSMRASFRWIISVLGFLWIIIGIIAFDFNKFHWQPTLWILIGFVIIYFFAFKPYLKRHQIIKNNSPQQDIILQFDDDYLRLQITGAGDFTRRWEELLGFTDTKKGILFYFNDRIVNWLPNRVFDSEKNKNMFIDFLKSHQIVSNGKCEDGDGLN